jgi:hypothetical protein
MRCLTASATLFVLFSVGFGQQTYPPINRNIELHEKSVRQSHEDRQSELQRTYDKARQAASEMVEIAGQLRELQDRSRQDLAQPGIYKDEVKSRCKQIRDLIKPIQEISFLDPGDTEKPESYERAENLDELTLLVDELVSLTQSIRVRLDSLAGHGVAIDDLRTQSLDGLTESASRLSKAVEKSASKM